jgi:YesN/AraC family two-component response regulator
MMQKENPDLILADVMMPEMDGYEMTEKIRQNNEYDGIPIILLTAKAGTDMKLAGFTRGANDYVVKPFNPRELEARIKSQLDLKRLRDKLQRNNERLYEKLQAKVGAVKSNEVSELSKEKIEEIKVFIEENYDSDITRDGLAKAVNMNPDHLGKVFNQHLGMKIGDYVNKLRIEEAARRLRETKDEVIVIAYDVGFESLRTFNRVFGNVMEMTPAKYRAEK